MEIQKIESRQELLLKTLHKYYYKDNNLRKMLNILNGDNKISLRLIDYFVTNYAKNNHTIYIRREKDRDTEEDKEIAFYIYREYRNQLKAYSKLLFDPFCRRDRIELKYNDGTLTTTIGQLNFFRWMLDNNLIDYIKLNKKQIEEEMSNKKKNKKEHKKNPVYKYKLKVAVHFEDETSSEATSSSNITK